MTAVLTCDCRALQRWTRLPTEIRLDKGDDGPVMGHQVSPHLPQGAVQQRGRSLDGVKLRREVLNIPQDVSHLAGADVTSRGVAWKHSHSIIAAL